MIKSKKVGAIEELKKLHDLGGDIRKIESIMLQEDPGLYYRIEKKDFDKYKSMLDNSLLSFSFSTPKIKPHEVDGKGDLCAKTILKLDKEKFGKSAVQIGVFCERK